MVWDSEFQTHDEPTADERERAMGFLTGTTAAHGLQQGQRRFLLGQAMDLNSIVWIIGIFLVAQHPMDDQLRPLKAENNGQGQWSRNPRITWRSMMPKDYFL
jgi:hypothetical protein